MTENSSGAAAERKANVSDSDGPTDLVEQPKSAQAILDWFVLRFSEVLGVDPDRIDVYQPTSTYGLGSVQVLSLIGELEDWLGRYLPGTVLWDYSTLAEVAEALARGPEIPATAP
jgi:acyl carrier protein